MGDSHIPLLRLVGLVFPFNFFVGQPQFEFLGCMSGHPRHDTHGGCAHAIDCFSTSGLTSQSFDPTNYSVSKKTVQNDFVGTLSNFHQLWKL